MSDRTHIALREATPQDARFVWDVNNHPSVRENSIDSDSIPWKDHKAWYAAALESDQRVLWVGEVDGEGCGVVRMDVEADAKGAEISVAVRPKFRGRGIGRRLIRAGSERILRRTDVDRVDALIRPDNEASIRTFEAAGYRPHDAVEREGVELERFRYE